MGARVVGIFPFTRLQRSARLPSLRLKVPLLGKVRGNPDFLIIKVGERNIESESRKFLKKSFLSFPPIFQPPAAPRS